MEHENIKKTIIINISFFITQLQQQQYDIILGIDANKTTNEPKKSYHLFFS